jgi:ABC-type multidrug transport system fused ATPase/permease subunit
MKNNKRDTDIKQDVSRPVRVGLLVVVRAIRAVWSKGGQWTVLSCFAVILLVRALEAATPYLFGQLVDQLGADLEEKISRPLLMIAIAYTLARLLASLFAVLQSNVTMLFERKFMLGAAVDYSALALRMPRQAITQTTSEFSWRLQHALNSTSGALTNLLFNQVPLLIQLVLTIAASYFVAGLWVAILIMAFAVLFAVVITLYFNAQVRYTREINQEVGQFFGEFGDSLSNMDAIKYFSAEQNFSQRLASRAARIFKAERKAAAVLMSTQLIQELFIIAIWGGVTFYALIALTDRELTVGQFVMLHTYYFMLIGPLRESVMTFWMFVQQTVDIGFLEEIRQNQEQSGQGSRVLEGPGSVEFHAVSFRYPSGDMVLREASFCAPIGKTTAILGPSGSGKTSVARALFALYPIESGRITIAGHDLSQFETAKLRQRLAIIPQDGLIFADTIRNNITLGRDISATDLERAINAANLRPVVERMPAGLETALMDRGRGLSGGELQRLTIARALAGRPDILMLDEATSNLDQDNEQQILNNIRMLPGPPTVLIVTHRPHVAASADRIVMLCGGQVVEVGSPAELSVRSGPFAVLMAERAHTRVFPMV